MKDRKNERRKAWRNERIQKKVRKARSEEECKNEGGKARKAESIKDRKNEREKE